MSKITYHKNCRYHNAVAKAKRMLTKIEKQYGGFQGTFWCDIKLTGIDDIDMREVKIYVERHLKELRNKIEKQLFKNEKLVNGDWNEQYEEGYYIPPFTEELQIVEALNNVYSFISGNYPEIEVKKSDEFVFTAETPEGKYNEAVRYFKSNPVVGFNYETFAVLENGESKKLWPLTFSHYELSTAKSVYVAFK